MNKLLALLRTSPLYSVYHLLRLGHELTKLAGRAAKVNGHRLALHILQDDHANLVSLQDLSDVVRSGFLLKDRPCAALP